MIEATNILTAWRRVRARLRAGKLVSAVICAAGVLLIAGSLLEPKTAVHGFPGHAIPLGTAYGLALAGLAGCIFGLKSSRMRAIHTSIGLMLAMLGSIGLAEDLSGELGAAFSGIHALLHEHSDPQMAGRVMSGATCIGFLLLGCILLLGPRVRSAPALLLVRTLIIAVAGLGALAVIGALLDLPRLLDSYWLPHFPLAAAAGFIGLALALWLDLPRASSTLSRLAKTAEGRILVAGMLVVVISIGTTGVMVFSLMRSAAEQARTTNLEFTLAARSALIARSVRQAAAQTAEVARRQGVLRVYSEAHAGKAVQPDPVFLANISRDLLSVDFLAIVFVDAQGQELARAGDFVARSDLHLPLPDIAGVRAALIWDGDLVLGMRADIVRDGVRLGEIVAQHRLPDLRGIGNDIDALGGTTELALCGLRSRASLQCMPTRFEPRVGDMPLAGGGERLPMRQAIGGQKGVLELTDHRGRHVLAAYAPVPNLELGLLLKTDISELDAPLVQRIVPFGLLLLLITAAGGWLLKRSVAPLAGRLAKSEQELRMALDGSRLALWDWDIRSGMVSLSEQWNALLEGEAKPMVSSIDALCALIHPDDVAGVRQRVEQLLSGAISHYDAEHRVRSPSGEWKWIRSRGHIVQYAKDGTPLRALGTNVDISERKAYELELAHHAAHDLLTGLPNRGLFDDRLDQAITRARRNDGLIAVLYVDVDRFKSINDRLGHASGDALLREFARRLGAQVRSTDTVARIGGDEFALILDGLDHRDSGLRVAAGLVATMRRTFELEGRTVSTSASVGMAFCDAAGDDVDGADLLARADRALYAAKWAGRNRYCVADEPRPQKRLRLA